MASTFIGELSRSAEMFIDIAKTQGAYFALQFLYDSQYTREDIKKLLPLLEKTRGSINQDYLKELKL